MFLRCVSDLTLDFNEEDLVAEPRPGVCLTFQDYKFDLFPHISRWGGILTVDIPGMRDLNSYIREK